VVEASPWVEEVVTVSSLQLGTMEEHQVTPSSWAEGGPRGYVQVAVNKQVELYHTKIK